MFKPSYKEWLDFVRESGTPKTFENYIEYSSANKHRSVVRRLIALAVAGLYVVLCLVWIIAMMFDRTTGDSIRDFIEMILLQPMNLIMSFYFLVDVAHRARG